MKKNIYKLGKTGQNWVKLGKTGQNWAKLGKTGQNQFGQFLFYYKFQKLSGAKVHKSCRSRKI